MQNKLFFSLLVSTSCLFLVSGCTVQPFGEGVVHTKQHKDFGVEQELPMGLRQEMDPNATHELTYSAKQLDGPYDRRMSSHLPPSLSKQYHAIRDAADGGNSMAQAQLGDLYFDGTFVERDVTKAIKWYQLAAENDFAYAQYMLAILYQEGQFVEQNIQLSSTWLRRANGSPHRVIAERLIADRSNNKDSQFYNKKRSIDWYGRAAEKMSIKAQMELAEFYSHGLTKDDQVAALKWYSKAAEVGNDRMAQYNLGLIFNEGLGVKKNPKEAFKWFKKAALQRVGAAQYHLAKMYETGVGTKQDRVRAYAWYEIAAQDLTAASGLNKATTDALKIINTSLTSDEIERAGEIGWELNAMFSKPMSDMQGR